MTTASRAGSEASLAPCGAGCWRVSGQLDFTTVTRLAAEGEALFASLAGKRQHRAHGFFDTFWRRNAGRGHEKSHMDADVVHVEFDLSGVETANSAGLALLLEWLEMASVRGLQLTYDGLPESLARIADFSNIRALLPADSASAR